MTLLSIGCTEENSDSKPETSNSTSTSTSAQPPASISAETAHTVLSQEKFLQMVEDGSQLLLLDVRTAGEFEGGHISGATNVSHSDLPGRLADLESHKNENVVVYCRSGARTAIAIDLLEKAGFASVFHLEGDMMGWRSNGRPVEQPADESVDEPGS